MRLLALLLIALLLCSRAGAVEIDCALVKIAEMPMAVEDHQLVVPIGIDGHWVHLMVDTGAQSTMISADTAERLGLRRDFKAVHHWMGVGGTTESADAIVDRMVIGGVHFPINRIGVGNFHLKNARGLDADGLLGADILLAFELDIDAPGKTLTLYRNRVCPHAVPPWPDTPIEIAGVRRRSDKLLVPFEVDGTVGMGIVDTGARMNVISHSMAGRLGVSDQALAGDPVEGMIGVSGHAFAHLHRFHLWQVGPIAEPDQSVRVMSEDFGVGDGLIGVEFMENRRVWLSFKNPQIFISKRPWER